MAQAQPSESIIGPSKLIKDGVADDIGCAPNPIKEAADDVGCAPNPIKEDADDVGCAPNPIKADAGGPIKEDADDVGCAPNPIIVGWPRLSATMLLGSQPKPRLSPSTPSMAFQSVFFLACPPTLCL